MEPQIRFCTSADGTQIAYATLGEGRPLVTTPWSWQSPGHDLDDEYGVPSTRPWLGATWSSSTTGVG